MTAIVDRLTHWRASADRQPGPGGAAGHIPALIRIAGSTALLLVVFLGFQRFAVRACRVPDPDLAATSMLAECLRERPSILLPGLAIAALLLAALPRLRQGWRQFDGGDTLRWFITAVALLLAWAGSAYAYNPWYDQTHLVDRATLVLLAACIPWRPVFVLPFVVAFWAVIWQFDAPSLDFQILIAEFRPVVSVLTMFSAALIVRAAGRSRDMTGFLFLTLCIVAANFWVPGAAKLRIGWITHGHLYLLLPNAYTHGWLGFLEPETVAWMGRILAPGDWPMRIGALIVECGALFLFAGVRTARMLLAAFTLLLGAFFLTLGYLFWKWIAVHAGLWFLLFATRAPAAVAWRRELFTVPRFVVSVVVIGGASQWFSPAALAWFDTPVTNALRYEGVGRSGAVYDLSSGFFAPYDSHVAMGAFASRLTGAPVVTGSYGATSSREMADVLIRARGPADVLDLETAGAEGRTAIAVDDVFARQFDEFVRRVLTVSNRSIGEDSRMRRLLSWIQPPPFLWTFPHGRPYRRDEPIVLVRVAWVSSFFDGRDYRVFRTIPLRSISAVPLNGEGAITTTRRGPAAAAR